MDRKSGPLAIGNSLANSHAIKRTKGVPQKLDDRWRAEQRVIGPPIALFSRRWNDGSYITTILIVSGFIVCVAHPLGE
jgi:hypothetical protein